VGGMVVVFGLQDSQPNFFLVNTSSGTLFYAVLLTPAVQRKGNSWRQGCEDLQGLSCDNWIFKRSMKLNQDCPGGFCNFFVNVDEISDKFFSVL
jgi:hypothetical protein